MRVVVLGANLAFVCSTMPDPEAPVMVMGRPFIPAAADPERLGHMSDHPGASISLVDPASDIHFRESSPDKLISLLQGEISKLQENNHRMKAELESFRSWTMLMEKPPAQATPNDSQRWKAMSLGFGYGIGASFLLSIFYGIFVRGSRGAKGMNMKPSDGADFQSSAANAFPLIPSGASNARLRTVGVVMNEGKECGGGEATGDTESTEASKRSDDVVVPMWSSSFHSIEADKVEGKLLASRQDTLTLSQTMQDRRVVSNNPGYAAALHNMIDRGEAATMEEARQVFGRQGQEAALQKVIDRGEAATMEEARQVLGRQGHEAALHNMIDRGEAATMEEAQQVWSSRAHVATLQNIIDRDDNEAATMEEARQVLGRQGYVARQQNMIDRGEAATMEEAKQVLGRQCHEARLQKIIDRGDAATLQEAQQLLSRYGRHGAWSADPLGTHAFNMRGGVASALAQGKRSVYPGVTWRKDSQKWRVFIRLDGGTVSLGSYPTERQACEVHDAYVRANKVPRPLHFPRDDEVVAIKQKPKHEDLNATMSRIVSARSP